MSRLYRSDTSASHASAGRNDARQRTGSAGYGRNAQGSAGKHAGAGTYGRARISAGDSQRMPVDAGRSGVHGASRTTSYGSPSRAAQKGARSLRTQHSASSSQSPSQPNRYGTPSASASRGRTRGYAAGTRSRSGQSSARTGGARRETPETVKTGGIFRTIEDRFGRGFSIGLRIFLALIVLIAVLFVVDAVRFRDKIYPNVYVGNVNVGGLTVQEAENAIYSAYAPIVSGNSITIYASESAKSKVESALAGGDAQTFQDTLAEVQASGLAWNRTATELNATVASQALAESALSVGREDGGLSSRLGLIFSRSTIEPYPIFDETAVEELAQEVDYTLGEPRVESSVVIQDGVAGAYPGNDGFMTSRTILYERLNIAFMAQEQTTDTNGYVAKADYAPQRITQEKAEATAQLINNAIANGAAVTYQGHTWTISRTDLGALTDTKVEESDGDYNLVPYLRSSSTQSLLLSSATEATGQESITISMSKEADGTIAIHPQSDSGLMPNVAAATQDLSDALYGDLSAATTSNSSATAPSVQIDQVKIPGSMSLDEAIEEGIVVLISTYTTSYSTGTEDRNNRNFNIRRCADFIDNSICTANGGTWNFNETTGECNEAAGFKNAGIIQDGMYTDAYGGGICQVATTLFNAVFEAGYPVVERHNHTLYPDNYPRGRDAAVDYGGYNFIWKNDTSSDVLVKTSHGDTTITTDLYGISPRLHVESEVSDWVDGEEYSTKVYVDESLGENVSYTTTVGEDGGYLVTTRKIYDASNKLVRTDTFTSNYEPQNEVKVIGNGEEAQSLLASGKATLLTDEIRARL